jgi:hypothetical protein
MHEPYVSKANPKKENLWLFALQRANNHKLTSEWGRIARMRLPCLYRLDKSKKLGVS